MTFASEIEDFCDGAENIESVIVGPFGWSYNNEPDSKAYGFQRNGSRIPIPQELKNKPQTWDTMRSYLDYNYDDGFGSPECHAVLVYTDKIVVGVSTYDGATGLFSVPRNPTDWTPIMPGGG